MSTLEEFDTIHELLDNVKQTDANPLKNMSSGDNSSSQKQADLTPNRKLTPNKDAKARMMRLNMGKR